MIYFFLKSEKLKPINHQRKNCALSTPQKLSLLKLLKGKTANTRLQKEKTLKRQNTKRKSK